MPLFARLSDAVWSYVSPYKPGEVAPASQPVQRDHAQDLAYTEAHAHTRDDDGDRKIGPSLIDHLRARRSMSPGSRVDSWRVSTSPKPILRPMHGKRKKQLVSVDVPARKRNKNMEYYDENQGLEGETLLEQEEKGRRKSYENDNAGSHSTQSGIVVTQRRSELPIAWTADDEFDDTAVDMAMPNERGFVQPGIFDANEALRAAETPVRTIKRRRASPSVEPEDAMEQPWPADAIPLLSHLRLRGHEPLLPSNWKLDFRYLPDQLFVPSQEVTAFIHSLSEHTFRSTKALQDLFSLGARVRDKLVNRRLPEPLLQKGFETYLTWAMEDARRGLDVDDLVAVPPLLAIETGGREVGPMALREGLRLKFLVLEDEWRDAIAYSSALPVARADDRSAMPTLYGLIISHTLVAIMAFNSEQLQEPDGIRTVGMFNFKDSDYDVWNAFALAILCVHVRNVAITALDDGLVLDIDDDGRYQSAIESDPDA